MMRMRVLTTFGVIGHRT